MQKHKKEKEQEHEPFKTNVNLEFFSEFLEECVADLDYFEDSDHLEKPYEAVELPYSRESSDAVDLT